jgi:anaerobic magnesium-protoporphyrin IX monomethyl ester cyclase
MRIVVAVPSITDFYFSPRRMSGLGAAAVARAVLLHGHTPIYKDFTAGIRKTPFVPLPAELNYLKQTLVPGEFGQTSFFSKYKRLGPSPEACAEQILAADPDAVLISCFAFAYSDDTLALARAVRKAAPHLPIAVGGGGPSASPGYFLKDASIDFSCTGEVESIIDTLLEKLARYSPPHSEIVSPDPEITPSPVIPIVSAGKSPDGSFRIALAVTRGCPKRCAFCSNFLTHGRTFRKIPLAAVREEIERLALPPGSQVHAAFEDDNILLDADYFFSVLEMLSAQYPGITFSAENGLDYLLLNDATISRLVSYGFTQFNLSAGSFRPETLSAQQRPFSLKHLQRILELIAGHGVKAILYTICGLPEDTPESTVDTLLAMMKLPADIGISPFYAVPGLPGFTSDDRFSNLKASACKGSSLYPWNRSLTAVQLATAFRLARTANLLKHPDNDQDLADVCRKKRVLVTRIKGQSGISEVPTQAVDASMVERFFQDIAE